MALQPISGQPVNLTTQYEQQFGCEVDQTFCVLYGQDEETETTPAETIMFEMIQTPCGDDLIVDGNFPDGDNWTTDSGSIVFADGKANHIVGSSAQLSQSITGVDLGTYYRVDVVVTNMSDGTLNLYFTQSGTPSKTITENGIYSFYLFNLGDNDNITFVWSSDCDASIGDVSVFKLLSETEIIANILNEDGVAVRAFTIDLFDEYVLFSIQTHTLDEGCYRVEVIDTCPFAAGMTALFNDPDFDNPSAWTVNSNSPQADIGLASENSFIFDEDGTVPSPVWAKASQPFAIPTGVKLLLKITVDLCHLGGDNELNTLVIYAEDSGEIQEILRKNVNGCISGLSEFYVVLEKDYLNYSNLDMGIMIDDQSPTSGAYSFVEYAQVEYSIITEQDSGYYLSNCLKVSSNTSGTRLVEGFAELTDTSTNPPKGRSLGFMFVENYFWLKSRLEVAFSNPHNPLKSGNNLFSNGVIKKALGQVSKTWDLSFLRADENMHDTIANMIECDRFTVQGQQYVTEEKDYSHNRNNKSLLDTSESKIEVIKYDGTRFNTNQ